MIEQLSKHKKRKIKEALNIFTSGGGRQDDT